MLTNRPVLRADLIREFVLADKTDQPAEKAAAPSKEVLTGRSAESIAEPDEKPSGSDLHYAGSIKVRTEKSRHSNGKSKRPSVVIPIKISSKNVLALPTTPTGLAQSSPLIASQPFAGQPIAGQPIAGQPFYYSNDLPLIPTFGYSYPVLAQSTYYTPQPSLVSRATVAPVVSPVVAPVVSPVVSPVVAPVAPEEIEIRRRPYSQIGAYDFIPPLLSDLLENRFLPIGPYLVGRALNGLLQPAGLVPGSPNYQYNPFLSYLLPQQTPSLNYLVGRSVSGLSGLNGYYGNGYYPSASTLYPSALYPQNYLTYSQYPTFYPPYSPQIANPIIPSASIVPQVAPADFVTRRTVEPAVTETVTTVTTSGVQPFSDSTTVQPGSAAASSVLITDNDSAIEKPLLYSSQSAALRSPYGGSYSNGYLSAYPSRIIDPTTGLPTSTYLSPYRYPSSSGYYSRYSYPYAGAYSGAYSGYYRPGLVSPIASTYPIYGPYNGVGYVSPMHYSADISALNLKSEDTKPAAAPAKEQATAGKDGNLMYSVKTSKTSESKETVSRLKQAIDTNKIREDDKKAA